MCLTFYQSLDFSTKDTQTLKIDIYSYFKSEDKNSIYELMKEISEKNTILALHCIHYACSHDRMGILQPDRLWCPWPLPWNYVWDRSFRFHRQNCSLLPQDRIYPSSDQYSYVPSCSLPVL